MRERPAAEVLVLMLAGVVCIVILVMTTVVAISEIRDSTADTTNAVELLANVVSTVLGALLGLMVGRSRPNGTGNGKT